MRCFFLAMALVATTLIGSTSKAGDVIDMDLSLVDPSAREIMLEAEKFWEDRIAGYSSELPVAIRRQVTALRVSAVVAPVDGVGNILGFAGPDVTVSVSTPLGRRYEVALAASITIDLDDFPGMEADGILFDTIVHELGHALGLGPLWEANSLLEIIPPGEDNDERVPNYVGSFGLAQYQLESGLFSSPFVPIEQEGGPGTAGGHWEDIGFFNTAGQFNGRKALMTGTAGDIINGEIVFVPSFLSQASLGSLADLGFAVIGVNDQFAVPRNQISLPLFDKGQFAPTILPGGVVLNRDGPKFSRRLNQAATGNTNGGRQANPNAADPYNLRNKKWAR